MGLIVQSENVELPMSLAISSDILSIRRGSSKISTRADRSKEANVTAEPSLPLKLDAMAILFSRVANSELNVGCKILSKSEDS